jgi:NarL family two-component system response regulator LiaR
MNAPAPIRVVVVDDHPMVRTGLTAILHTAVDIEKVGEAADGEEAVRVCSEVRPDVVLMDLQMPRMDGIAAIRELRHHDPPPQVLVLTTFSDDHLVQEALHAGAIGYLLKDIKVEMLVEAIRAAKAGRSTLSSAVTLALVHAITGTPARSTPIISTSQPYLTEREREVLEQMVAGRHNREIAQRLVITPATVKYHIKRLFAKLGVSTRTELVATALQRRLVE